MRPVFFLREALRALARKMAPGARLHVALPNPAGWTARLFRSTWHGLGYRGRPDRAKRVKQDRAAKRLHAQSGWSAWPSCAQREHLR